MTLSGHASRRVATKSTSALAAWVTTLSPMTAGFSRRAIAASELARRGTDLETFLNQVEVHFEDGGPQAATIDQALSKLDGEAPLWSMWTFANCLEESLVVQKSTSS